MSKFIKLGPCPHCGSRDNRAEYENGYWCFGCSKLEPKNDTNTLRERVNGEQKDIKQTTGMLENIKELPQKAMKWLLKYDISQKEIKKYGIVWNPLREILILIHRKNYWQGKTFGNSNIKYLSQGIKPLTIYGKGDTIILVEDVLSAIKIARLRYQGYCSSPLLGSSLSEKSRDILRKNFKNIYIWLDRDKANQAIDIRNNLKSFGINSKVIITKLDPKEYNKEEITNWLKN